MASIYRMLQRHAHESPVFFYSVVIGAVGPVMALTVPPIRRRMGYEPAEFVPTSYPPHVRLSILNGKHMDSATPDQLTAALDKLKKTVPSDLLSPRIAIICGSGLSALGSAIDDRIDIPYNDIPGFLTSHVPGHQSILTFGWITINSKRTSVVAMLGRFHAYEGHSLQSITFPIRVFSRLGCRNLILTNAAGSLNEGIPVGTVVVIHDHLSFPGMTGLNPLLGPKYSLDTPRFLPLSNAYSRILRKHLFHSAHKLRLPREALAEGTYCWVTGPTFETAAEGAFLKQAGGDVVGASTVPEVIVAREEGIEVLVLSLVTNMVIMPEDSSLKTSIKAEMESELTQGSLMGLKVQSVVSHDEVLAMGLAKAETIKSLVIEVTGLIE